MKKYVIEKTFKNGKKSYGELKDTREAAEAERRGWLTLCGGKCPFKMEILELDDEREEETE